MTSLLLYHPHLVTASVSLAKGDYTKAAEAPHVQKQQSLDVNDAAAYVCPYSLESAHCSPNLGSIFMLSSFPSFLFLSSCSNDVFECYALSEQFRCSSSLV